jgi:hypothetical protein
MGLRFFADHCVSNTIMQTLREAGHEVVRLREQLPVESRDADVIAKAQQLDAILLSLNGDFADIVTYPPADYQGDYRSPGAESPRGHSADHEKVARLLIISC